MLSRFLKNRLIAGALISIFVTLLCTLGIASGWFSNLHAHFADSLYTLNEPSEEIVIIAIDDKSTDEGLGRFSKWSRTSFTELLKVLMEEDPGVVTFDLIFDSETATVGRDDFLELESKTGSLSNEEKLAAYIEFVELYSDKFKNPIDLGLAEQFKQIDKLVLAAVLTPDGESMIKPITKFAVHSKLGLVSSLLDQTGIVRKSIPYFYIKAEDKYYPDLAVATVEEYLGQDGSLDLPLENGQLNVNFFGDPYSYQMIPFIDVLNGQFEPGTFKDKIVLIGATASKEIHDEFYTPRSNVTPMPGVEFRANEIQTILEGKFLNNQKQLSQIMTIAVMSLILAIIFNYLGIVLSIVISIVSIVGYLFAAHVLYGRGLIVNMVYPFVAIILVYIFSWVYKYTVADKSKREIKSAFSHYVSDKLVEEISKNPEMVKLGGEKKVVTVFFSDIKDSTTLSEKTEIQAWVVQINEYFTVMERVLKTYGCTVDKYEGDAIMGFWNAPISQEHQIRLAYNAALDMLDTLEKLNRRWQMLPGRHNLSIRIGVNTGEAIVGNFGSATRFDYTVMGDTVNVASRLESSANKTYGTSLLVAGFEDHAKPNELEDVILREVDTVILPGKKSPVRIHEVVCRKSQVTADIYTRIKNYADGLQAYRQKNFDEAIQYFSQPLNLQDSPSIVMLERCKKLQNNEIVLFLDVEKMIYSIGSK